MLEEDEVFNSSLLKDYINQMISAGRRNFAIDVSPLDYIYSDTINVLMVLNKRALEVSGRLALLTPQAEVVGIIQKAGIPNVMRVFGSEAELLAASDEIMAASANYAVGDLQGIGDALNRAPLTEFESLRTEIGSVMTVDGGGHAPAPQVQPPPIMPPPPQAMPPMGGYSAPPAAPMQPPPIQTMSAPPIPPPVQTMPAAPLPPKAPAFPPPQPRDDSPDTQKFPEAPAIAAVKGLELGDDDRSAFDDEMDIGGKYRKKKSRSAKDRRAETDRRDSVDDFGIDDEDAPKKKGLPMPAIIAAAAVLVLAVVGVIITMAGGDKKDDTVVESVKAPPPPPPPVPEPAKEPEPISEPGPADDTPVTTVAVAPPAPPVPAPAPIAKTPPPAAKKAAPPPAKTAPPAPVAKTAPPPAKATPPAPVAKTPPPAPVAKAPATPPPAAKTAPPPPPAPAAQRNQIVITSTPRGATVEVDGERKGITPFTWNNPPFGDMTIAVSLNGYTTATRDVDYTGGTKNEAFTLRQAPAASPPAPTAPPPPPAAKAAPPAAAPAASGASIFIATLPSHADVYIGGRLIGKSNDGELQVPVGTHQVRFVKGDVEKTESLTFQAGKNPTRFVPLK